MSKTFKEVDYKCTTGNCTNTQTIRYFPDDAPLGFTCCVKCRAGFGRELGDQAQNRIGMFPVKQRMV